MVAMAPSGKTHDLKGLWKQAMFGNGNPITLELGCGSGEYTVGLASQYPDRNFIGIDIKSHRFHEGAKTAVRKNLPNAVFLRARLDFIQDYFSDGEIHSIWLPFSDPQPKDKKGTKRITSKFFIEKYKGILEKGGLVHVKTDSAELYQLSKQVLFF